MDIIIIMRNQKMWFPFSEGNGQEAVFIQGIGLHENMSPKIIRRTNDPYFILMYFHSPALASIQGADPVETEKSFIVFSEKTAHFYGNSLQEWDHSWLVFGGKQARQFLSKAKIPVDKILPADFEQTVEKYHTLLLEELKAHSAQDFYIVEGLMKLYFHELSRILNGSVSRLPQSLSNALNYMELHLDKRATLSDLAAAACLSIPRFCALFKKHFGRPPMKYLTEMRMQIAAQALRSSSESIKQIAQEAGFGDQLHFSRVFKSYYKQSPRAFGKSSAKYSVLRSD